jgi:putative heme-binding domain-containing protein
MWIVRIGCALVAAGALMAQQGNVDEGGRLYRSNCSNCHGITGDMIAGVDLGHGKFRRASTDEDLIHIITTGISGTGMPPANMPQSQAASIVAYLRSLAGPGAGAGNGDPVRGKELFAAKGCAGCHRILGTGSRVGPDLSEIGSFRRAPELEQSILDPGANVQPDNRTFNAVTRDGTAITGRVINEDAFTLQVLDSHERLLSLNKADLREYSFAKGSAMPSYKGKLSQQELADLVNYLLSLKRMDSK